MRSFEENIGEIRRLPWPEVAPPVHAGLLSFPARLLSGLPLPVRLEVIDGDGRAITIATGRDDSVRLREAGVTVIDADEWAALAEGAESDRVFQGDLAVLLALRGPGRITAEQALSGARADPPRGWSVSTVLGRLGLEPRAPTRAVQAANGDPARTGLSQRAA